MGNVGLTNWKLVLKLEEGPGQRPGGYLEAASDRLHAFKTQNPGVIDLSNFSPRLSGKISFTDGNFVAGTGGPIRLDGKDLRPGQLVEVYPDERVETQG